MRKKRGKLFVTGVLLLVITLCVGMVGWYYVANRSQEIPDDDIPLGTGTLISQGADDIQVIPDKYNTGCTEEALTKTIISPGTYNNIPIYEYGSNALSIRVKDNMPSMMVFENVDFSAMPFVIANDDKKQSRCIMKFVNCKFSSLRITDIKDTLVEHVFENCSFVHFAGSNSTFTNCYFGDGSMGDGINPYRNCTFENCMIANLVQPSETGESNHVDGLQIFGDSSSVVENANIHLKNCRFEVPNIPYTSAAGILNCPITFTMRYGDASNISFEDCIVNGGTYYSIMVYSDEYMFTDVSLENIRVGGSRKSANVIGDTPMEATLTNIYDTPSLYIGSVWKDSQGIHLSVTNDTNQERKLKIITSNGTYDETIAACPVSYYITTDSMDYEDFPFDLDICVADADWVVCYDVTSGEAIQIRYMNWTNSSVMLQKPVVEEPEVEIENEMENNAQIGINGTAPDIETESSPISVSTGICGDNVTYELKGGILTLSGTGSTYGYNSSNPAPWYDMRGEIVVIEIGEGITALGNQLFVSCENVKEVVIPEGVVTIGGNAFIKNKSLKVVTFPATLTTIEKYAFASTAIEQINYTGTEEQWQQITIGQKNDKLLSATINYIVKPENQIVEAGTCGESVSWTLYGDGTLELTGEGATGSYNSTNIAPWGEYRSDIKRVVIQEGITQIGSQAFALCINLEQVKCPDSLTAISSNAFIKDQKLTLIEFGSQLEEIGRYAFSGTKVATIKYHGTEADWTEVQIAEKNDVLLNATMIYNE